MAGELDLTLNDIETLLMWGSHLNSCETQLQPLSDHEDILFSKLQAIKRRLEWAKSQATLAP